MQLFLTLNDLAGRFPFLDACMRGVYVGTIPLLSLILLALLILAPRDKAAPARGRIALATILALAGVALLSWGIETWAQSLNLGIISPRPFMTRWVNLLIVEPQDNSFPCIEVAVATVLAVAISINNRWWGIFAALATLLLMTARLFCGSNYGVDVGVGALAGFGLMLFCLALCRAPHGKTARMATASAGVFTLGATALGAFIVMASMPRFAEKLRLPWGLAAPTNAAISARSTLQEGEGIPTLGMASDGTIDADEYAGEAEAQALSKRATLFLPASESALTKILTPRALPFRLLDVEVAPVNFKDGSYRAAALRFEINSALPNVRQLVAQRAATLVKAAFAADPKLDNVDIIGVTTGDQSQLQNSLMRFAGDELPVFTASVQRRNLVVGAPKWANDPNLEGGLWLRTRSRLWINDQVLPPKPKTTATATPTPLPTATEIPTATAIPEPTPTPKPNVKAISKPTPTFKPKPSVKATPKPKITPEPSAKPTARATIKATGAPSFGAQNR